MKYVIWGAGKRAARLMYHLNSDEVMAFIDKDKQKVGNQYFNKEIITIEEYEEKYTDCVIIISCISELEVVEILEKKKIYCYLRFSQCPADLTAVIPNNNLKNYVARIISPEKKYVIYGGTLYSLLVYDWLQKEGLHQPYILEESIDNPYWLEMLKKSNYRICTSEEINKLGFQEMLVTEYNKEDIVNKFHKDCHIRDIFDCAKYMDEYYNPKIEKFHNIYDKERCFIIALGPSLTVEDLNKLYGSREICISMNEIWMAFSNTNWRPQYYVTHDENSIAMGADIYEKKEMNHLFIGDTNEEFFKSDHSENILKMHYCHWTLEDEIPKFSEDFSRVCYGGATVTYACMQLAVYMGFKEIYLLGVDFSYGDENENTTYKHFYEEKNLTAVGFPKQVYLAYCAAKKYADEHNIKIYNATRGGKLEVFERVDFDSLFD